MFTLAHAATPPVPGLGHAPALPGQRGQLLPRGQGRHGGHDLAAAAWAAGPRAGHNTAQDIFIISVLLDIFYLYCCIHHDFYHRVLTCCHSCPGHRC